MGTCASSNRQSDSEGQPGITVRQPGARPASRNKFPSCKVVLLGDSATGKTSVAQRFTRDHWDADTCATIGAAFTSHVVDLADGRTLQMDIWDTAGQERYKSLAPLYYRNASGAVVMFDLTDQQSFDSCLDWVTEFMEQRPGTPVILVGNKTDLLEGRVVSNAAAQGFADTRNLLYIETSAKENNNILELFHLLANKILDSIQPVSP